MQIIRAGIWPTMGPPWWVAVAKCPFWVGRGPSCELKLDDPGVSARHLKVSLVQDRFEIEDLDSTNGTKVQGKRVQSALLEPGSPFVVGGYTLKLYLERLSRLPVAEAGSLLDRLLIRGPASEALEPARAWALAAPREPLALAALALCLALANQSGEAAEKAALARALGLGPKRSALVEAALLESRGYPAKALDILDEITGEEPPAELLERYRKRIGEKLKVYAKVSRFQSEAAGANAGAESRATLRAGPFEINFLPSLHGALVLAAQAPLVRAAEEVRKRLGFWPEKAEVMFLDFAPEAGGWRAAEFDGAIRINAGAFAGKDPNFLLVALAHEYVHLAVAEMAKGLAPAWLDEGLAQYLTQNLKPTDGRILARALEGDLLLPLDLLEDGFGQLKQAGLLDLAYAQAHSLAEYMVDQKGWPGVQDALVRLGRGEPPEKVLAPWGGRPEQLELNWRKWLG